MTDKVKRIWKDLLVTEKLMKVAIRRLTQKLNFKINPY